MYDCFSFKKQRGGAGREKRGDSYQDTKCLMQSFKLTCMPLWNAYKDTLFLVC